MKTQAEVRKSFWEAYPQFKGQFRTKKRQNEYNATIRTYFVDYIDYLQKDGQITKALANRVTL